MTNKVIPFWGWNKHVSAPSMQEISLGHREPVAAEASSAPAPVLGGSSRFGILAVALVAFALMGLSAKADGSDATAIVTAASTAFGSIATLCVSIGTFFVVYRLVKRVG